MNIKFIARDLNLMQKFFDLEYSTFYITAYYIFYYFLVRNFFIEKRSMHLVKMPRINQNNVKKLIQPLSHLLVDTRH